MSPVVTHPQGTPPALSWPLAPRQTYSHRVVQNALLLLRVMHRETFPNPLGTWEWVLAPRERLVLQRVWGRPCFPSLHRHPGICRALHNFQMECSKSCNRNAGAPKGRWSLEA